MSTLSQIRNDHDQVLESDLDTDFGQHPKVCLNSTNVTVDAICRSGDSVTERRVPIKAIGDAVVIPIKLT